MSDYNFDLTPLIWLAALVVLAIWGCWELVDWLWIEESIRSSSPIIPELEIVVKNNIVDTVYIYKSLD